MSVARRSPAPGHCPRAGPQPCSSQSTPGNRRRKYLFTDTWHYCKVRQGHFLYEHKYMYTCNIHTHTYIHTYIHTCLGVRMVSMAD